MEQAEGAAGRDGQLLHNGGGCASGRRYGHADGAEGDD